MGVGGRNLFAKKLYSCVISQIKKFLSKSTGLIVLDYRVLLDINMEQIVAECKSLRD